MPFPRITAKLSADGPKDTAYIYMVNHCANGLTYISMKFFNVFYTSNLRN